MNKTFLKALNWKLEQTLFYYYRLVSSSCAITSLMYYKLSVIKYN
jgi:hypothetical protein